MKARFTDEQIITMIKEQESGEQTADVCWRHEISSATFYKYKSKYGGMEAQDEAWQQYNRAGTPIGPHDRV
ncbi:MAG: transposase [Tateyamaria sp.]